MILSCGDRLPADARGGRIDASRVGLFLVCYVSGSPTRSPGARTNLNPHNCTSTKTARPAREDTWSRLGCRRTLSIIQSDCMPASAQKQKSQMKGGGEVDVLAGRAQAHTESCVWCPRSCRERFPGLGKKGASPPRRKSRRRVFDVRRCPCLCPHPPSSSMPGV